MHRKLAASLAALSTGATGAGIVLAVSCNGPTEARLVVVTDFDCPPSLVTEIYAEAPEVYTTLPSSSLVTTECQDRLVGDVVLTPRSDDGRNDELGLRIVTKLVPTATCAPGDPNCIVAKRRLRYREHESIAIRVLMSRACAGVDCPGPDQTCVLGRCESAICEDAICDKEHGDASAAPDASSPAVDDAGDPKDGSIPIVQAQDDHCRDVVEQVHVEPGSIQAIVALGPELIWLTEAGLVRRSSSRGSGLSTLATAVDGGTPLLTPRFALAPTATRVYFTTPNGLFRAFREGGAAEIVPIGAGERPTGVGGNGTLAYFAVTAKDGGAGAGSRLVSSRGSSFDVGDRPTEMVPLDEGLVATAGVDGVRLDRATEAFSLAPRSSRRLAARTRPDGRIDVCFVTAADRLLECGGLDDGGAVPTIAYPSQMIPADVTLAGTKVVYAFSTAFGTTGLAATDVPGDVPPAPPRVLVALPAQDGDVRLLTASGDCVFFVRGAGTILRVAAPR